MNPTLTASSTSQTATGSPLQAPVPAPQPSALPLAAPGGPPASSAPAPVASTSGLTGVPPPLPASSSFAGPVAAGLFLALLAVAAFFMARRRRTATRLVEILETASLGPKRALVVARLGEELLVLGSSEGGIALLSSRPAAGLVARDAPRSTAAEPTPPLRAILEAFSRLRRRPAAAPSFERLITESVEDVELRRKLEALR
jgi:flagellar protein FliO/FliZ